MMCSHLSNGEQHAYTEQPEGRLCLDCASDVAWRTGRRSLMGIYLMVWEARVQKRQRRLENDEFMRRYRLRATL